MTYTTQFIDAPTIKTKGALGITVLAINGNQFARDVAAALQEKTNDGFRLVYSTPVISTLEGVAIAMTSGILLIFEKNKACLTSDASHFMN